MEPTKEKVVVTGTPVNTTTQTLIVRKSSANMTAAEWTKFKNAVTQLINNGTFLQFRNFHQGMTHDQHGMGMSPTGYQRFLPWHRSYLFHFEQALRQVDGTVFIPYWDWTSQRRLPQEMTGFDGITSQPRAPGNSTDLPTAAEINAILNRSTYTLFTRNLEDDPHNQVHGWVGGDMNDVNVSPGDPVFWLHHANIDRIWSMWQQNNTGKMPSLTGVKRILDPWNNDTIDTVNDITAMGYSYQ